MEFVSVPKDVLQDLLWNAELLVAGMGNDAVERQAKILWSYMPEIDCEEDAPSDDGAEVIDLFTRIRL